MNYNNIHQYLNAFFLTNPSPSKEEIIEAKAQYHKLWHRQYNKKRRNYRKEFTLGFNPKTLADIKSKKGKLSISKFLYDVVFNTLDTYNASSKYDSELLADIRHQLMSIIALLEEVLDSNAHQNYEAILEQVEALEIIFNKLS